MTWYVPSVMEQGSSVLYVQTRCYNKVPDVLKYVPSVITRFQCTMPRSLFLKESMLCSWILCYICYVANLLKFQIKLVLSGPVMKLTLLEISSMKIARGFLSFIGDKFKFHHHPRGHGVILTFKSS